MRYGRYQKKLYQTFSAIAGCFVLLFTFFACWTMVFSQRANYRALLQQTMAATTNSNAMVASSIADTIESISENSYAAQWAASSIGPEYYYSSSMLYQTLSRVTANISNINYDIVVTRPDDSFMITSTGTMSKDDFFQSSTAQLSRTEWDTLLQRMEQAPTKQAFLSTYADDQLVYLHYIKAVSYPQSQPLLLLVTIPASTFLGNGENQNRLFFALYNDSVVAQTPAGEHTLLEIDTIMQQLSGKDSPMLEGYEQHSFNNREIFLLQVQHLPLKLVYVYPYSSLDKRVLFATLGVLLLSAAGTLLIAAILSRKLYYPIGKIMSRVALSHNSGDPIDEFEVIEQNTSTVSLLNEQLENAIVEKNNLVTLRYYRELLFTIPDCNCPLTAEQMSAKYCVALVEFTDLNNRFSEDDWYLQLQKNYLYVHVQGLRSQYPAYCISTNSNSCAVLVQTDDRDKAEQIVQGFFSIPGITCQLRIALSDVQEYVMHIQDCYQQALQLMEYRHLLPNASLITSNIVQPYCHSNYYYLLSTESRLILLMVSGNEEAIALFDSVLDQNLQQRTLSPNSYRSFIFACIGTVIRAFEELKTTPEELLGREIDFSVWYASADSTEILSALRHTVCDFVTAVQQRQQNSDDLLLQNMLDFIYENYADDIMLNDIAQHCGVSASYCSTLFKRLSCDNFKTFLNRYRIEQACRILKEDPGIKITDLSQMVGFNSSSSFIRVFQRFMGTSPKAYAESLHSKKRG